MKLYESFRRVNRTKRTEDAVGLRVTTLLTVEIAVLATLVSGAAPAVDAAMALALLPVGAWVSYRRRGKDNTLIKLALTVGAVLALQRFFGDVRGAVTVEDTRAPLAGLFLAVQVLHGFDLPARRDLGFTIASSLTLIALAATNTYAGVFGVLMVAYVVTAALAMMGIQRSAARERADGLRNAEALAELAPTAAAPSVAAAAGATTRRSAWLAAGGMATVRTIGAVLLVGGLVFGLLPRTGTNQLGGLPFKGFPSLSLPSTAITNPGLDNGGQVDPDAARDSGGPSVGFNPTSYFGFAEYVDLRTGGRLSDDPILRVRADRPRFWRGIVFDTYDGKGWTRSAEETPQPVFGRPVRLNPERYPAADYARVTQTFELLGDTPNLLFAAGEAFEVHLAGGSVNRWDDGTITTGQLQEEGTIYSVVSRYDDSPRQVLRAATGTVPEDIARTFTQLPDSLPQRVIDLAEQLTAGAQTPYAKAEAIERWIGANTEYTLEALPPRDADDLVDHFLFESRQGWCEPIAASMAVMLRAVGVPARFATGFQPGDRNPLSGVYDVKISDAHAWVEVFVPGHGWVPFDPTGAVPEAVDGRVAPRLPLFDIVGWAARSAAGLVPAPAKDAARSAARAVADNPIPAGVAGIALAGVAGALWARRRRAAAAGAVPTTPFERLEAMLAVRGVPRDPWQTPREYVRRVRVRRPDLPAAGLDTLLAGEERRRYGPEAAGRGAAEPAREEQVALAQLQEQLAQADQNGAPPLAAAKGS